LNSAGCGLHRTDVAGIVDLAPLSEILYDEFDADHDRDYSSDLGGAVVKAPISLKQTQYSLKQYAKRMGQPNCSIFNNWKKVWVARFQQKKHPSIFLQLNWLKPL